MSAKPRSRQSRPKPAQPAPGGALAVTTSAPPAPAGGTAESPEKLTPEEQMERFAQELKNEDWGHQPC
jgi:hypothetical protein